MNAKKVKQAIKARNMKNRGYSNVEIAKALDVSETTVRRLLKESS